MDESEASLLIRELDTARADAATQSARHVKALQMVPHAYMHVLGLAPLFIHIHVYL